MNPWKLSEEELQARGAEHTAREMCQQPDAWEETTVLLEQQAAAITAFVKPLLAKPELRIIFTGAGTSAYAGDIIAPYLREKTGRDILSIATTDIVSAPHQFLHDGRARNLLEAILWHGGEAQSARDRVADMTPAQRTDIIAFLESL